MKTLSRAFLIGFLMLIMTKNIFCQEIGISLGQASDNSYTQSEAAKFVGTFPDSDTTNYLINSYLSIDFSFTNQFKISIVGELQKNTLIEKEQHVEQVGLKISKVFQLVPKPSKVEFNSNIQKLILISELSGKYSNDKIDKKEGAQIIWSNSFSVPKTIEKENLLWLNWLRPNTMWPSDIVNNNKKSVGSARFIQLRHKHNFGIEDIRYESLTMGNLTFGLELYPFSGLFYNLTKKYSLLQITWNYVYRFDISNSNSSLYVGPLKTYGVAFNYKFDKENKNSFSIGYEYIEGGNPLKGLADQKYGQLSVKAKIKI